MERWLLGRGLVASCALAFALSAAACGDNTANDLDRSPAGAADTDRATGTTDARGHEGAPITVTGCLQKGEGMNNYILTGVNRPTESVGTSGSTGSDVAERQQVRSATHAFRLEGENDRLEPLVGKQVRVAGTYEQGSDIWREMTRGGRDERGTSGTDQGRAEIDQDDLAQIDVNTIEQVADACGQSENK